MDSEPELMIPALQVEFSGSEEEFDLNIPPSSGNEYLRRVRLEAQQCPDVVVAKIDQNKLRQCKQNSMFSGDKGCQPAPSGYAPSIEWQRQQVADFSKLRLNLATRKKKFKKNTSIDLPSMDDDVGWCKLCFGNQMKSGLKSMEKDENEDGLLPLVSIVSYMSQPLIEQVLDYHLAWFETTGFTAAQGRWFFALLACLEKPLTPDACSSLRTLVRYCANLRAVISNDDKRLAHLNLLICLVTRYFDQYDLADE